jgi:hypothetical protein
MIVKAQADEGANGTTEIENNPEDSYWPSFLGFRYIGCHDCSLGNPKEGGTDA